MRQKRTLLKSPLPHLNHQAKIGLIIFSSSFSASLFNNNAQNIVVIRHPWTLVLKWSNLKHLATVMWINKGENLTQLCNFLECPWVYDNLGYKRIPLLSMLKRNLKAKMLIGVSATIFPHLHKLFWGHCYNVNHHIFPH
jgi:hypothetical protein